MPHPTNIYIDSALVATVGGRTRSSFSRPSRCRNSHLTSEAYIWKGYLTTRGCDHSKKGGDGFVQNVHMSKPDGMEGAKTTMTALPYFWIPIL